MINEHLLKDLIKEIGKRPNCSDYNPLSRYTIIDCTKLRSGVKINGRKITEKDISMNDLENFAKEFGPMILYYKNWTWLFSETGAKYIPEENIGIEFGYENKIVIDETLGLKEDGTKHYIW